MPFALGAAGSERALRVRGPPDAGGKGGPAAWDASGSCALVAESGGQRFTRGVVRIEHPHIPIQTTLVDARRARWSRCALATGGVVEIGYFPGPGRRGPGQPARRRLRRDAARRRGAGAPARRRSPASTRSSSACARSTPASGCAPRTRRSWPTSSAGGTLVVQYNTNNRLAPLTAPLGPWPFDIGQKRVTDETAAVDLSVAEASGADDAERDRRRATSRAGCRSAASTSPTSGTATTRRRSRCTIPDEPPLAGSLLWARHGKGTFVYTGPGVLPAAAGRACPGAYRLFANLLARRAQARRK